MRHKKKSTTVLFGVRMTHSLAREFRDYLERRSLPSSARGVLVRRAIADMVLGKYTPSFEEAA